MFSYVKYVFSREKGKFEVTSKMKKIIGWDGIFAFFISSVLQKQFLPFLATLFKTKFEYVCPGWPIAFS
jgi:hypothetical protein